MVSVVGLAEHLAHLLRTYLILLCQPRHIGLHLCVNLLARDAADGGELGAECDIGNVVEGGKDAELREFRDACDEAETYHRLARLQALVELLHHAAVAGQLLLLMEHLKQRRVVFVDYHHHLAPRLLIGTADEAGENFTGSVLFFIDAIDFGQRLHLHEQSLSQLLGVVASLRHTHIDVEHGIFYPLFLQFHHLEPLKEVASALEEGAQRGGEQRLAETAWPA